MSCSHLITGYTNSIYIFQGVTRFIQSFTCGKCASCISKNRTDWRVRSYYEAKDCLSDSNNFVLFDTLTYSDEHIKRYSDIFPDMKIPKMLDSYCFSRADLQKFFKRLRINLKRSGYRFASNQLRYIVTSEYGSSEQTNGFKNTHRPHYHILFFVSFPISPIEFSRYISRSWYCGKTDGVRPYENCVGCPVAGYCKGLCLYQSSDYVLNERLVQHSNEKNCIKCVNYVTKYISKDMYVIPDLQFKVDLLWRYLYPDYKSDLILYRQYRRFCNQVMPFHLQSQLFGYSLLRDKSELKYILDTGKVKIPTSNLDVVRSVALPRYYQRKLFYDHRIDDGRLHWFLTDFGKQHKMIQLYRNIRNFKSEYCLYDPDISADLLNDLAIYRYVYRGSLSKIFDLCNLDYRDYYWFLISDHDHNIEKPLFYNFNCKKYKLSLGSFLSTSYYVSSDGEIIYKGKQDHKNFVPPDGYVVVNARVMSFFKGLKYLDFDKRLCSYENYCRSIARSRDDLMFVEDQNTASYKALGLLKS